MKGNTIPYSEIQTGMEIAFNDPDGNLSTGKIHNIYLDEEDNIIGCEVETADEKLFDLSLEEGDEIYFLPNNKTDDFVTVQTFTYPHEAMVIRARLESEGIECFLKDELTVQVNPFYSNAIGGVKLQVKASDLAEAIEILKEAGDIW